MELCFLHHCLLQAHEGCWVFPAFGFPLNGRLSDCLCLFCISQTTVMCRTEIEQEYEDLVKCLEQLLSSMQKKKQEEDEMERLKRIQEEMERERKRHEEEAQKRKQEEDDRRM